MDQLIYIPFAIIGIILLVFFGPIALYELVILICTPIANRNRLKRQAENQFVTLQIRVSKTNEKGPLLAEQLFNTLHGAQKTIKFRQWLAGHEPVKFSLEIANLHRSIRFFVYTPKNLQKFVEGQLYSQYPSAEISEIEDYANFMLNSEAEAARVKGSTVCELKMFWHSLFPIRRYVDFEDKFTREAIDPIGSITATLDKLNHASDQAWIQIVVEPASVRWQKYGWKLFAIYKKGYFLSPDKLQIWFYEVFMNRSKVFHYMFYPTLKFLEFGMRFTRLRKTKLDGESQAVAQSKGDKDLDLIESTKEDKYWDLPIRKLSKNGFDVKIRMAYIPGDGQLESAKEKMREMTTTFKSFNLPFINGFEAGVWRFGRQAVRTYAERRIENPCTLNTEELATVWHLPNKSVETPSIWWVTSKKLEPPADLPNRESTDGKFTSIGVTNYRGHQDEFGIKENDRRRHVYIIGKTGMGKSTLLENMIFSDIAAGKGIGVVDPHGDLAETILKHVPSHRTNDVILFDPSDREFPVGFNMLECPDPAMYPIVTSGVVGIFKKMYAESWGPRLEHILRNTILTLLWYPDSSMLGIMRILVDPDYRKKVVDCVKDPMVRAFWETEYNVWQDRQRLEAVSPIQNKVGQFLSSSIIRNIIGQPKSSVDLRYAMDNNKIFICNLSKGKIGEDNSSMLGSMIITKFQIDAMSRANIAAEDRKDFYLYVDEFQNFATDSFATILSEARKYKLNLTMANQFIAQMPEEVRDAVFGNVGSIVSFQVGFDDAEYLSEQFGGEDVLLPADLTTLPVGNTYLRLLVDNMPTRTFSAKTFPPIEIPVDEEQVAKVVKLSHERYSQSRESVEDRIVRWSESGRDATIKAAQAANQAANRSPWEKPEIPWRSEKNREEFLQALKNISPEARALNREEYENFGVPKDCNEVVFVLPAAGDKLVVIFSSVDFQGNIFFKKLSAKIHGHEWDPAAKKATEIKLKVFKDEEWARRLEKETRKFVPVEKQIPAKPENELKEDKKEEEKK